MTPEKTETLGQDATRCPAGIWGMRVMTILAAWLAPESDRGDQRKGTLLAVAQNDYARVPATAGRD